MATREENLKTINDQLEKLNDEQLEKVAGGTYHQTAGDAHFLHALDPNSCVELNEFLIAFSYGTYYEETVKNAWAKYGVELEYHGGAITDNVYKINGKEVSRDEAFAHARAVAWG
ncbi:MAG: hypothetical protein IJK81_11400 [Selenomonadaceae bacterium]|nr:hypothetical protein [Selenomonadaceae bacterium]